jgi:hypothetical protein
MTDADQFMPQAAKDADTAKESNDREGAGAGTSSPSEENAGNATNDTQRHSYTDRRTDIRTTDRHYSWREVYAVNHVHPGR